MAVFVYLVVAITVEQFITGFDAVEIVFKVALVAGMAWLVAKMHDRHWRRSTR